MKRMVGVVLVLACLPARAWSAEDGAMAVIDKAIKVMGGQERFEKAQTTYLAYTNEYVSADGTRRTLSIEKTSQGVENFRATIKYDGTPSWLTRVINGDEGWQQMQRGTEVMPAELMGSVKCSLMAQLLPARPDLLKSKTLDVIFAGEEMVGGRPAVVLKVTGQDLLGMKISFDKERGLPIKSQSEFSTAGLYGFEERVFSEYKEFHGIQVATKIRIETKQHPKPAREPIHNEFIKEFKILDKVPADTFTEPK